MRNQKHHDYRKRFPHTSARPPRDAGWEGVAEWYAEHLRDPRSLLRTVVYPGAMRLLAPRRGGTYLDVACGEGTFAREVVQRVPGATVVGVDASPALVRRAGERAPRGVEFRVGDARTLDGIASASYDGATLLLAATNIDPIAPVFAAIARVVKRAAPLVLVLPHPCFRIPRQSGWGWDDARQLQYRRVDRYATPLAIPIAVQPGAAPGKKTTHHHRPLAAYVAALAAAGFAITALEEWTSNRTSDPGRTKRAEDRARSEIPVFLALRAEHQ